MTANPVPGATRFRESAVAHGAGLVALVLAAFAGTLPWPAVGGLTAVSLAGHLLLWGRLRALNAMRLESRQAGHRIAFGHTLFTLALVALACAWLAPVRGAAWQLTTVAIAFDIHRLSRRQTVWVAIAGLPTAALSLTAGDAPVRGVDVLMLGACLTALACVAHRMRSIQQRQQSQRVALSAALSQWQSLSRHDALTGALCRRHGSELLQQEAERQQRDGRAFCVGLLDADHFKRINDTHGHALGDAVLVELVRLLQAALGAQNRIVRWGGEEFLLLLPAANRVDAVCLLREVRDGIVAHDWSQQAAGLTVDVSIGVAEHRDGDSIDATVARADTALYIAKAEGRGRVVPDRR